MACRFRRLDGEKLAAAKKEFLQMERDGIVRRSNSPWSSPLHMVRKPDGSWRPCGDYRRLNLVTVPDSYPLPNMLDFSERIAGCTIFSKVDLRKGYHQILMHPGDIEKTAIATPFGLFEFLRMTFGLRNAGNTFQRQMDRLLSGLDFVFVYLDDIIIGSRSAAEHVRHLRALFQRQDWSSTRRSVSLEWRRWNFWATTSPPPESPPSPAEWQPSSSIRLLLR